MTGRAFRGKILKWGNSYGIRLRKEDLERLHLNEGSEVDVVVEPTEIDISGMSTFRDPEGRRDLSERLDEIVAEYVVRKYGRDRKED